MCDEQQLAAMGGLNRRQFARVGAGIGLGGALAACTTTTGDAAQGGLAERNVSFSAPGGTMDGFFVHPAGEAAPGVILWPDIAGLRDSKRMMARRLAGDGYAVFVANPYHRSVAGEQFADFEAFREGGGFQAVGPWMQANTPQAIAETAEAVVAWLDAQDAVDTTRGIGNQGYCMTGGWTIRTAAAVPSRVKAAASFHGGGLSGEDPMAPIHLIDDMADDAHLLVAIARDDDADAPEVKTQLRDAASEAGVAAEIEVYEGDHGWTVLDSPVYAQATAERAYADLLELYSAAL